MAKKQSKVSVNTIDRLNKMSKDEYKVITYEINGEQVDIKVKPYLTIQERGQIVTDIADAVFIDGVYAPYMLGFAYKYGIIAYFTNLSIPQNPEKLNVLINSTDIINKIEEIINDEGIYVDALDLIEYRKNMYLKNNKADELLDALTSLINNLDNIATSDIDKINPVELLNTAKKIADKDEKSLVENILEIQEAKRGEH